MVHALISRILIPLLCISLSMPVSAQSLNNSADLAMTEGQKSGDRDGRADGLLEANSVGPSDGKHDGQITGKKKCYDRHYHEAILTIKRHHYSQGDKSGEKQGRLDALAEADADSTQRDDLAIQPASSNPIQSEFSNRNSRNSSGTLSESYLLSQVPDHSLLDLIAQTESTRGSIHQGSGGGNGRPNPRGEAGERQSRTDRGIMRSRPYHTKNILAAADISIEEIFNNIFLNDKFLESLARNELKRKSSPSYSKFRNLDEIKPLYKSKGDTYSKEELAAYSKAYSQAYTTAYTQTWSSNYFQRYESAKISAEEEISNSVDLRETAYARAHLLQFNFNQDEIQWPAECPDEIKEKPRNFGGFFAGDFCSGYLTAYDRAYIETLNENTTPTKASTLTLKEGVTLDESTADGVYVPGEKLSFSFTLANTGDQQIAGREISIQISPSKPQTDANRSIYIEDEKVTLTQNIPANSTIRISDVLPFHFGMGALGKQESVQVTIRHNNQIIGSQTLQAEAGWAYKIELTEIAVIAVQDKQPQSLPTTGSTPIVLSLDVTNKQWPQLASASKRAFLRIASVAMEKSGFSLIHPQTSEKVQYRDIPLQSADAITTPQHIQVSGLVYGIQDLQEAPFLAGLYVEDLQSGKYQLAGMLDINRGRGESLNQDLFKIEISSPVNLNEMRSSGLHFVSFNIQNTGNQSFTLPLEVKIIAEGKNAAEVMINGYNPIWLQSVLHGSDQKINVTFPIRIRSNNDGGQLHVQILAGGGKILHSAQWSY